MLAKPKLTMGDALAAKQMLSNRYNRGEAIMVDELLTHKQQQVSQKPEHQIRKITKEV